MRLQWRSRAPHGMQRDHLEYKRLFRTLGQVALSARSQGQPMTCRNTLQSCCYSLPVNWYYDVTSISENANKPHLFVELQNKTALRKTQTQITWLGCSETTVRSSTVLCHLLCLSYLAFIVFPSIWYKCLFATSSRFSPTLAVQEQTPVWRSSWISRIIALTNHIWKAKTIRGGVRGLR